MAKYNAQLASLLVDIVINTRRFSSQLNNIQNQTNNAANKMRRSLTQIGLAASAFLIINKAANLTAAAIEAVVKASIDLEKQLVSIQAIAKFESFDKLQEKFFQLADALKGVSFAEITQASQEAARLGIRGGPEEFLKFVEASSKLARASGDITFAEAAEGLGKLILNFNIGTDKAEQLASAIDKLNDEFPITSGQIINSSTKLSGLANTIGLTVQELTALVTALRATGTTSTVVESSLTRLFVLFEQNAAGVADALGLQGEAFQKFLYNVRNAPMEAIKTFFEVLSKQSAQQAVEVLAKLELTTAKNAPGYLNLAKNVDNLNNALRISNTEFETANNLNTKFNTIAETGAAKLVDLEKNWTVFKASLVENESVKDAIDWVDKLITGYGVAFRAKQNLFSITPQTGPNTQESIEKQLHALRSANEKLIKDIASGWFAGAERGAEKWLGKGITSKVYGGFATMFSGTELGEIEENQKKINKLMDELQEILTREVTEKAKQEELEKARTKKLEEIAALEQANRERLRTIVGPALRGEFNKNLPGERMTSTKAQKFALDMEQYWQDFLNKHKATLKEVPEAEKNIRQDFLDRLQAGLQKIAEDELKTIAKFLHDVTTSFEDIQFDDPEESTLQSKITAIFDKLEAAKKLLNEAEAKLGGASDPLRDKFEKLGQQAVNAAEKLKFLSAQDALGDLAKFRMDNLFSGTKGSKIPELLSRAQKLDEIFNRLKDAERPILGGRLDGQREKLIAEAFKMALPEIPKPEFGNLDSIWQRAVEKANEQVEPQLPPEAKAFIDEALPFFVKNEDLQKALKEEIAKLSAVGAVQ